MFAERDEYWHNDGLVHEKAGFAIETRESLPRSRKRFVYLKLNDFVIELVEAGKDVPHDPC